MWVQTAAAAVKVLVSAELKTSALMKPSTGGFNKTRVV